MEERTRAYLRGRFRDYYRRADVDAPPAAAAREWGYIPWTRGPRTTMVRHTSLVDVGTLSGFLERERPRHVYYSAGRYEDPGAEPMDAKGWHGSDLVFDIDADHLPGASEEDPLDDLLAAAKRELVKLLDVLVEDVGVDDPTVVFSGGRGYHLHVRDAAFRPLGRDEREEIADYVEGTGVDVEALLRTELVGGDVGRTSPASRRELPTDGGWSRRVHEHLLATVDDLLAADREDALERLQSRDGFGERKAEAVLTAAERNYDAIAAGNVDVHGAVVELARRLAEETVAEQAAHVDAPVTTDVNRLIRLPGSLHGGTGLVVTELDPDDVEGFDPGTDAVAAPFADHEATVDVPARTDVALGGRTFTYEAGTHSVPEHLAVLLMARGDAEKGKE
ncbi:MAG: DNA primase catalytic subunit PriS [Halobacteriaceae archaeon]